MLASIACIYSQNTIAQLNPKADTSLLPPFSEVPAKQLFNSIEMIPVKDAILKKCIIVYPKHDFEKG